MPVRFLAVISPDSDIRRAIGQRAASGANLAAEFECGQLLLLADSTPTMIGLASDGAIVGHLFERQPPCKSVAKFDAVDGASLLAGGCAKLLRNYWGGYVAFLQTPDGFEILRDPSGALPCYAVEARNAIILGSDAETLHLAGCFEPNLDWSFLSNHLYYTDLRTPRTGFVGLTELLPGQAMHIAGNTRHVRPAWSPWDHVTPGDRLTTPDDLRETISACIRAWASRFKRISLGVSGGLDSSIVAAALAGYCDCIHFTFATDEIDGDERRYARILANHLGVELREAFHRLDQIDLTRSVSRHLPRPVGFAFGQSLYAYLSDLSDAEGVDGWFSGIGGDNVFCFMGSATPVLDRFLAEGPHRALTTLLDVCDLTGATLWDALRNAFGKARRGRAQSTFLGNATLLAGQAFDPSLPGGHPWLQRPRNCLPGKAVHVGMLARIQGTIDGVSRFEKGVRLTPLLSQPIVEACLRIPTWQWCERGRDRAMARLAFEPLLPAALINRRSKGGPGTFAYSVISRNRTILRGHLLGGALAQNRVIDVEAVRNALADDTQLAPFEMTRLSALAEAEAWARHWLGRRKND